jgi:hypothetical protein
MFPEDDFDIESLLKDELGEGKKEVPSSVFSGILAEIEKKKRKKRLLWFFFWMGLGLTIGWFTHALWLNWTAPCNCPTTSVVEEQLAPMPENQAESTNANYHLAQNDVSVPNSKPTNDGETSDATVTKMGKEKAIEKPTVSNQNKHQTTSYDPNSTALSSKQDSPQNTNESIAEKTISKQQKTHALLKLNIPLLNPTQIPLIEQNLTQNKLTYNPKHGPKNAYLSQPFLVLNDTLISSFSLPEETMKKAKLFNAYIYGGPSWFNMAVFKPYFISGDLSSRSFQSSGYDFGIGLEKKFNRFGIALEGAYDFKQSQFEYDLMISEEDYFELYENNEFIPLEQLDDPSSCDCFLAEDAALNYSISTLSGSIGLTYVILKRSKWQLTSAFHFGTDFSTRFRQNSQAVISFPDNLNEQFNSLRLQSRIGLNYQLTPYLSMGIMPEYLFIRPSKNHGIYAKSIHRLTLPLRLSFHF